MPSPPHPCCAACFRSNIFKDVHIYVNGLTDPPAEELKRLVVDNGGVYEQFCSRRKVTHVIAGNLCGAKIAQMGYVRQHTASAKPGRWRLIGAAQPSLRCTASAQL